MRDRFVQQAAAQVLQKQWDPTFSEHSYGFRPRRSAHQAVAQAQRYMAEGPTWVVDLDWEKFSDRVNPDKLMGQVAKRVADQRRWKLIRAFLNAGVMEDGLGSPSVEGTPQGGPLSPLLSNFPGFSFTSGKELKRKIAPKAIDRFQKRVREITQRRRGVSLEQVIRELARYVRGGRGSIGFCQTPSMLGRLDWWIRRRLRCAFWRQWKTARKRCKELVRRGTTRDLALHTAGSNRGPWRLSRSQALSMALSNAYLASPDPEARPTVKRST